MSDETYSFSTARTRLDEIVTQVRKKDTSLEKSLDLLEEGVRLANACTELIDHADWTVGGAEAAGEGAESADPEIAVSGDESDTAVALDGAAGDSREDAGEPVHADTALGIADDVDAFGDAADDAWAEDMTEPRDDEA